MICSAAVVIGVLALAVVTPFVATLERPVAEAQQTNKTPRIGYLSQGSMESGGDLLASFRQGLRELGYVEGRTIVVEPRFADGRAERITPLATELLRLKVDVFVVNGTAVPDVQKVSGALPIVFTSHPDPVGVGLVASLARPGGNVTGLSDLHSGLVSKRLELLKEIVPTASRVVFVFNPAGADPRSQLAGLQAAAVALGLTLVPVEVKGAEAADLDRAFAAVRKERPAGLVVHGDPILLIHRRGIADHAVKLRLPTIYTNSAWTDAGGLISYGVSFPGLYRRAATYVDKILKGARPADLPVEQPSKFELVINLKTAKAMDLTVPQSLAVRADRVIE
jgi:putative ABC transport system substrate-binding protein